MPLSSDHPANALLPGYQYGDYSAVLYRWNYINSDTGIGSPAEVSFSFMTQRPGYYAGSGDFLNFQSLTAVQMDGARMALSLWAEVANLTLIEVDDDANGGMGGQIRFGRGDTSAGGYAFFPSHSQKGGDVLLSNSVSYLNEVDPGTVGFETILHEIGHALGLEHSFGSYPNLADFDVPDSKQYSLMSYTNMVHSYLPYFEQHGSSYSYGYSYPVVPETPMVYDIAAMQILYGANTATHAENDIYTFDTNPVMLRTIWDAGGIDTIDLSNQYRANIVSLIPGEYSSIGYTTDPLSDWPVSVANSFRNSLPSLLDKLYNGENNLGIAFDAVIENVIGGSGDDFIKGNDADNSIDGGAGDDLILGGEGSDILTGGPGNDILDGGPGMDTAVYSGPRSAYHILNTGLTWTVSHLAGGSDGVDTLTNIERLQFSDAFINILFSDARDYNADGIKDILWRHISTGEVVLWEMDGTSTYTAKSIGRPVTAWQILDSDSDFNGDGKADLLWRNAGTGEVLLWQMDGTNGKTAKSFGKVSTAWQIVDSDSDFNGDGKADLLWRNAGTGEVLLWQMDGVNGKSAKSFGKVSTAWQIVDSDSDSNGDGKADLLWRNVGTGEVLLWQMDGVNGKSAKSFGKVSTAWQIVDSDSDSNGDGKADLLWRNTNTGEVLLWQMDGLEGKTAKSFGKVGTAWQIVDSDSDFNGDGKSDLLWRNTGTGEVVLWEMDGTNGKTAQSFGKVSNDWQILDSDSDFNGDGKSDLLWRHSSTGEVVLWEMDGVEGKTAKSFGKVSTAWQIVDSDADYNGDGKADLLWQHSTSGEVVIWQMDGINDKTAVSQGTMAGDWAMVVDM